MDFNYDIIVVGGGHAGCEAAHISAFMGKKTLLITSNKKNIADMPCNPSIGGSAKGIIVREIDALGGLMGIVADKSHFQIKILQRYIFCQLIPNRIIFFSIFVGLITN